LSSSASASSKNATSLTFSTELAKPSQAKPPQTPPSAPKSSRARSSTRSETHDSSDKPSTVDRDNKPPRSTQRSADDGSKTDSQNSQEAGTPGKETANSDANGESKSRANPRAAGAKAANPPQASDLKAAAAIEDPRADVSNTSGLSLLQLLAQSSAGKESDTAPPTDSGIDQPKVKAAANDPNGLALSMLTQALAAAFGGSAMASGASAAAASAAAGSATAGSATAGSATVGSATVGSAGASDEATDGVTVTGSATSSTAASAQQLVALLAQDLAANANGKSDADAVRSDVAATKRSSDNTTDNSLAGADKVAQSLAQLGAVSHFSPAGQSGTAVGELNSPVGSAAWRDELAGQLAHEVGLAWMTHRGLESGSLRVSPEHLGPVEVQITVQNGDASVWFGASHPDTRAALEQALPRLREMFANQGLTLTDSGVSRESPRNQTRSAAPQSVAGVTATGTSEVSATAAARLSLGLIDTYA
jgi:flagellar hook-length control protein FliK